MKKSTKCLLVSGGLLLLLSIAALLTAGKTYKMSTANRLFTSPEPEKQEKALRLYQDLAVDLPASPQVRHNLGLAYYTTGRFSEALAEYQKVEAELAKGDHRTHAELIFKSHYHLGSALFTLGETVPPEEAANYYQQALSHFTEAIRVDPADQEAKYNYELTKLRLEAASQQLSAQQPEKSGRREGDEETPAPSQEDAQTGAGPEKEEKPALPEEKQQHSASAAPEGMSKEEAEALLEMAEQHETYQAPIIISTPTPPGKDW